jgi:integrase
MRFDPPMARFGEPIRPEVYSDEWRILLGKAKVRVVTLHGVRHSSVTAMREAGIPDMAVAQWHGHDERPC